MNPTKILELYTRFIYWFSLCRRLPDSPTRLPTEHSSGKRATRRSRKPAHPYATDSGRLPSPGVCLRIPWPACSLLRSLWLSCSLYRLSGSLLWLSCSLRLPCFFWVPWVRSRPSLTGRVRSKPEHGGPAEAAPVSGSPARLPSPHASSCSVWGARYGVELEKDCVLLSFFFHEGMG